MNSVPPAPSASFDSAFRWADRRVVAGDFPGAAVAYGKAASRSGDPWLPGLLEAICWMSARRPRTALPVLERLRTRGGDEVTVALVLQAALAEAGEVDRSSDTWLDTVRRFGDSSGNLDVSSARKKVGAALRRFPDSPMALALHADLSQVARDWPAAEKGYRRAIALAPSWSRPRVNLGIALTVQGKAKEAVRVLDAGARQDSADPRTRLAIADAQLLANEPERALATFRSMESDPRYGASARLGAGRAALVLGREREARSFFEGARRLAPQDPAAAVAVAQMQSRGQEYLAAAASYADALRLAENGGLFSARPSLLRSLVDARIAAGDHDNALATLERARRDQPAEMPLWWRLEAKVWSAKQEFGSRDRALRSALDSDRSLIPTETLRAIDAEGLSEKMVAVYKTQLAAMSGLHADPPPTLADSALQTGDATALRQPALRSPGPGSGGVESAIVPALRAVRSQQAPPPLAAGSAPPSSVGAPVATQRLAAPALPRQVPPRSPAEVTGDRELRVQCLTALGHLYEWRGQYREAMAVWQDLTRLRGSGNDWFLLAKSLERSSRWAEARDAWRKAVRSGELPDPARKHAAKKLSALGG